MEQLMRFFSPEAGQRRRTALEQLVSGVEQFVPPNLRPAAEAVVQMNPVQGISDAMSASGVAFDPEQTAEARRRAAVDMGVEMAMTLAPAALVRMGYLAAPAGLMETFATPSVEAAVDMGRNALSDAQYAVRSVAQSDPRGVIDAIRPSGQPQSLSAGASNTPPKMRAFHGTPHDFEKFDLSKIGTGEGAQAYGHGLYFAENERIAKHYKDKLAGMRSSTVKRILEQQNGDLDAAIKYAQDEVARLDALPDYDGSKKYAFMSIYNDALDDLQHMAAGGELGSGHMYEVNVSASPDQFINYDTRLDEQSDLVKSVLGSGEEVAGARLKRAYDNEMFGGDMIGQDRATPEQVSQGLLSRGIKGIRYLDASSRGMGYKINLSRKGEPYETEPIEAGSRRQAEALAKEYQEKGFDTNIEAIGNRNMVVFDDRLVEIVRKYGIAGAAALLGVSSADIEGALAQGMPAQPQTGLLQ
jgi:hypothetical protein